MNHSEGRAWMNELQAHVIIRLFFGDKTPCSYQTVSPNTTFNRLTSDQVVHIVVLCDMKMCTEFLNSSPLGL